MNKSSIHIPVMAWEVKEFLNLKPQSIIVDCTLGLGGHAEIILKTLGFEGLLIGIDRDKESLAIAQERLHSFASQCVFIQEDYRNIDRILTRLEMRQVDGFLFDLGISSYQLDNPLRGFSFLMDGPLDMRMDQNSFISAYDLINSLSECELSLILKKYGDERWHNRIARLLVQERSRKPISSTQELRETVLRALPSYQIRQKIDPATRTFQAFRIAVNRELEALEISLNKCVSLLKPGGRICMIAFHSLEDRMVKIKFRQLAQSGELKILSKKPLRPSEQETQENSRSRSARLRVGEKI